MTDAQIQEKLLEWYKEGLKGLPMEDWKPYLEVKYLSCGICYCADHVFGIDIYNFGWVKNHPANTINGYWAVPPRHIKQRSAAAQSLQTRIDILTKLLTKK